MKHHQRPAESMEGGASSDFEHDGTQMTTTPNSSSSSSLFPSVNGVRETPVRTQKATPTH